jgi:DNA polymerase/3'-5' exonuclease PolX
MSIQNPDLTEIFKKVADLLEIEGESRFKIKAYRDAAHSGRKLAHGDFGARLT